MNNDTIVEVKNFHKDDYSAFAIEIPEIPRKMPISGRRGSKKLEKLRRRAEHLQERIASSPPGKNMDYDKGELAALKWAISNIIMYEGLLKKGPEEETEEAPANDQGQTDTR